MTYSSAIFRSEDEELSDAQRAKYQRLAELADIEAGDGALYFAGVVILTMLAAKTFDPRLIWDNVRRDD